jgi:hypothetical protein
MAEIVDARASGGAILVLGDALALPVSSVAATSPKPLGSVRFNPDLQEIEVYRLANSSYTWKTLDRFVLDTSGFYPVTGGPLAGGITFTNGGSLYSTLGTPLEPAICFTANMNTGISGTNLGHLQFSTKGSLTFKANQNTIEFPTSLQAPSATITTVTTTTLNADSINTFIPREVSFSYIGTFTPLKVVYRYIVARRLVAFQDWAGSIATLGTPASTLARFQIRRVRSNVSDVIGTITFQANSTIGTFSTTDAFTLHGADRVEIISPPIADEDMADLSVTLSMTTPMLSDLAPIDIAFTPSGILADSFWPQGTVLGTVATTDTDSSNFNYSLLNSAKQQYQIVGNLIQVGSAPFKGGQFTVQVTDDDGLTFTKNFSVTVPPRTGTSTSFTGPCISGAFSAAAVAGTTSNAISTYVSTATARVGTLGTATDQITDYSITAAIGPVVSGSLSYMLDEITSIGNSNEYASAVADGLSDSITSIGSGNEYVSAVADGSSNDMTSIGNSNEYVSAVADSISDDVESTTSTLIVDYFGFASQIIDDITDDSTGEVF